MLTDKDITKLKNEIHEYKQKIKLSKKLIKNFKKEENNSKELKKKYKKDQKFITLIKEKYKNPFHETEGIKDSYNSIEAADKLYKSLEYIVEKCFDNNDKTITSIVGDWGSGKTTLINYLIWKHYSNEIKKINDSKKNDLEKNKLSNAKKEPFELMKINISKHELTSKNFIDSIIRDIEKQMNPYQAKVKTFSKTSYEAIKGVFSNSILSLPGSILPSESSRNLKKIIHSKKPYLIIFDEFDKCSKDNIELFLKYFKNIILDATDQIHIVLVMNKKIVEEKLIKLHPNSINQFLNKHITHTIHLNKWLKFNENNEFLELNNSQQQYFNETLNLSPKERKILTDKFNFFFINFKNNINKIYNKKIIENNLNYQKDLVNSKNNKFWKQLALVLFLIKYETTQQKIFNKTLKYNEIKKLIYILKLKYKNFSKLSLKNSKQRSPNVSIIMSEILIEAFKNFQNIFEIFFVKIEKEIFENFNNQDSINFISDIWSEIMDWLLEEYKYI